ncbi:hypothetical protein HGRIS_002824 [Hohenbuehelia grisea]|uniref:Phosphoglycerate mutase-like protein n=1 Tax=Hohenbuehelia grisea TaxID=104357 RepID=A0ABR3JLU0_9AGAR
MFRRVLAYCTYSAAIVLGSTGFDPLQHSGPASPYFDAPVQPGLPVETPSGCKIDQAAFIVRHGSRYPEPGSFQGWLNLFSKFQNATYTARGPLAFIPSWTPPVDDISHEPLFLSSTGASEAFALGVELRKRYGFTRGGDNFTLWSASQQRVVDTAAYYARGYLSQGSYIASPDLNRGFIVSLPDSVKDTSANSLTPSASCPAYASGDHGSTMAALFRATYQNQIASRLNRDFLDGLELNAADVGVMQDLCGFSDEINGDQRFCNVFKPPEWLDYEYAHDLNYYYGSGPGNPLSATVGFPWVKAVTELFLAGPGNTTENGSFIPPPLIMGFTHDNNLPPILSALGLWNATVLPPSARDPNRMFRSSFVVAFRGYVAMERLSCSKVKPDTEVRHVANQSNSEANEPTKKFVRIRVNNAPVPIPGCSSGPGASCPLDGLVKHIQQRSLIAGRFVQQCGLENVADAVSDATFLTQIPIDSEVIELSPGIV